MKNHTPENADVPAPPPLSLERQALLEEYLSTLEMFPGNTPRLFAIGFLGLPGTGKSTLADRLGARLGLPVNRSDQIRRFLNEKGFPGPSPLQESMAAMAEGRTCHFYENRTSAILDANFTQYAANSLATAAAYGASLLLIRVICPDDIAIERLKKRAQGMASGDSATTDEHFAEVKARVATFTPVEDVYYEVNTTEPLEPQVEAVATRLRADRFVA